ncbi:MAG: glycogen synthase [Phaeodactylibacter sp.]|nr:glycogen synthase [Phaeodactylibacter sp.]MCB9048025.1 glycogen synthase [Lewinellaceae bacterium]
MKVLQVSAECYPAAKAGGLGDVVGALPKYLSAAGVPTGVIIPKYRLKWINEHQFHTIYKGAVRLHNYYVPFTIQQESTNALGFPFFVADIPGKFDRAGIYADPGGYNYGDDVERYLSFQQAVLQWILNSPGRPALLHCHDHHTGLIPFMVKHCPAYKALSWMPTVFTIHNGNYHGAFGWDRMYLLPFFEAEARGLLDWSNHINPLATAVKCTWRVTTVSPSYLKEIQQSSGGMESLLQHEQHKSLGIINGIDFQIWDPATDSYLPVTLQEDIGAFKKANKQVLAQHFQLDPDRPLISFIGRLVREKGADLIPDLIRRVMHSDANLAFAVLGTGEPGLESVMRQLSQQYPGRFNAALEYNEGLAHLMYAGSDFLFMPSRVEPCGLNQMYAMRYGAIPIVRSVGGLRDSVPDIGAPNSTGRGIRFDQFNLDDGNLALYRAVQLYHNRPIFEQIRERIMQLDFSWERSVGAYIEIYKEMGI